jgi:hypothetical protein
LLQVKLIRLTFRSFGSATETKRVWTGRREAEEVDRTTMLPVRQKFGRITQNFSPDIKDYLGLFERHKNCSSVKRLKQLNN